MKNLIVPFLFCNKPRLENFAWIFCKYTDFCLKNDMPIITEEEYCTDPKLIEGYKAGLNVSTWHYTAISPSEEQIKYRLQSVLITNEEKMKLFGENVDIEQNAKIRKIICCAEYDEFEKIVDAKISCIEEKYGKIDAILTWIRYPSLVKCAKQHGIQVIGQELSSIRGNDYYKEVFGYFNFNTKYTSRRVYEEYKSIEQLLDEELILNRKDILALVLEKEHLDVLNRLDEAIYEFGIDYDAERDMFFSEYSGLNWEKVIENLAKTTDKSNILARFHPGKKSNDKHLSFDQDLSLNSMEWILKCRRIVSGISNVGFEAMLLGRTAYVLSPNIPYYCGNIHSLKNIEEKSSDIKLLNYMVFAYFAPWELMFDCDYIRWRLKNPKIIDVYRKNLSFVLNKIEIDYSTMLQMNTKERFGMILKMKHNLSDSMIAIYMTKQKEFSYSEMCQIFEMEMENSREKIRDMERIMNNLDQELDLIRNSTSWKVTKPLRNIGQIIRNYRR